MSDKTGASVDFYRQLSLLMQANLPLPGSLRSMATGLNSPDFRKVINSLASSVESGKSLSEAMRSYPGYFQAQYVEMIKTGEQTGTLSDTLHEVGMSSRIDQQIASLFRDIFFYPVIVLFLLVAVFLGLNRFVFYPLLSDFMSEYFSFLMGVAEFIHNHFQILVIIYLSLLIFCFWMLGGSRDSTRILLRLIRILPGFAGIFRELQDGRICIFLSMMMKRGIPEKKIFPLLALCVHDDQLSTELLEIGKKIENGTPIGQALEHTQIISPVIGLSFAHIPEPKIPGELASLGQLFLDRSAGALRRLGIVWETATTLAISLAVILYISALFLPYIKLLNYFG